MKNNSAFSFDQNVHFCFCTLDASDTQTFFFLKVTNLIPMSMILNHKTWYTSFFQSLPLKKNEEKFRDHSDINENISDS